MPAHGMPDARSCEDAYTTSRTLSIRTSFMMANRSFSPRTSDIEPAVYLPGYGGVRHCDVVTVGPDGARVLTPFQGDPASLVIDTHAGP